MKQQNKLIQWLMQDASPFGVITHNFAPDGKKMEYDYEWPLTKEDFAKIMSMDSMEVTKIQTYR